MLVLTSTSAQVAELGYVFSARSVGYLFGSMVGGPLFDKLDGNKLLALALFITSIGTHRRRSLLLPCRLTLTELLCVVQATR
jgi:MFS family permease